VTNAITADRRHFEDLAVGEVIALGTVTVTKEMIISFAREFDPFPFHLDEAAAKASLLGGLAASGWQTASLSHRLLTDAFLNKVTAMGTFGFTNLKWKQPVMVGDTIGGSATITSLRRSDSKPDRGIGVIAIDIRNQRGEPVMTLALTILIGARAGAAEAAQ
jgi:acyl dehydratase